MKNLLLTLLFTMVFSITCYGAKNFKGGEITCLINSAKAVSTCHLRVSAGSSDDARAVYMIPEYEYTPTAGEKTAVKNLAVKIYGEIKANIASEADLP